MNNVTTMLKIDGMHCASCAMSIDGELEDTKGVQEAITSYVKQYTKITYDRDQIDELTIIKIIKRVGYKACAQ